MKNWIIILLLLSIFSPLVSGSAQEIINDPKVKPSRDAYQRDRRPATIQEEEKLADFAEMMKNKDYDEDMEGFEAFEKEVDPIEKYAFPAFVSCLILITLTLLYNYLIGMTADKGKILQDKEAEIKAEEERVRRAYLDS